MKEPLKLGVAGLGTVGAGLLSLLAEHGRRVCRAASGVRSRWWRSSARDRAKARGVEPRGLPWFDDPVQLAADPGIDVFVELIGGEEASPSAPSRRRSAPASMSSPPTRRCSRRHGTELARLAEKQRRGAGFRGRGGGRHSRHQDHARGAGRQPDPARLRHPQRHLQLHPDADAGASTRVRRRARRRRRRKAMPRPIRPSTSAASMRRTSWRC